MGPAHNKGLNTAMGCTASYIHQHSATVCDHYPVDGAVMDERFDSRYNHKSFFKSKPAYLIPSMSEYSKNYKKQHLNTFSMA